MLEYRNDRETHQIKTQISIHKTCKGILTKYLDFSDGGFSLVDFYEAEAKEPFKDLQESYFSQSVLQNLMKNES